MERISIKSSRGMELIKEVGWSRAEWSNVGGCGGCGGGQEHHSHAELFSATGYAKRNLRRHSNCSRLVIGIPVTSQIRYCSAALFSGKPDVINDCGNCSPAARTLVLGER
ncbi:hypothetical protein J6590_039432 [Homalodisca vitripennis]|nr:hypothetical protein J6590_039432 [Homalodisca vitripennis]